MSSPSTRARSTTAWACADAYLFDIDGTLLNTRDAVHYHAFHHALREVFAVNARIDGVPVHGNTDPGILRAVLRREGWDDVALDGNLRRALDLMCAQVEANARGICAEVCPGARPLINHLHAAGKLLGVVSGNLERIGWLKLEAAGLRRCFAFGAFSDHTELRADIFRQGLARARRTLGESAVVCVVGDTPSDILAARAAGLPMVAVASGIYPQAELLTLAPDACFPCCDQLLSRLVS